MGTEPRRVTKVYRQTGEGRRQLMHGLFQKKAGGLSSGSGGVLGELSTWEKERN